MVRLPGQLNPQPNTGTAPVPRLQVWEMEATGCPQPRPERPDSAQALENCLPFTVPVHAEE